MATQDLRTKLVIEAQAEGKGEVRSIADELEALASSGGDAAPKLNQIAQALRGLEGQSKLVGQFTELRREVVDTATAMDKASAEVDHLGTELQNAAQEAAKAARAQAESAQQLATAASRQAQLKQVVAETRAELQQSRSAYKAAGDASGQMAQQIAEGAAQLKVFQAEQRSSAAEVKALAAANKENAAISREAAATQSKAATEYERSVKSARELSGTLGQQSSELAKVRTALDEAGLGTRGLGDAQAELRAQLAHAQQEATGYVGVLREMRGEANNLGPALEATFKRLGMRGVQQITAEIEDLQAAMRNLKGQQLVPEDAARATAELTRRIETLRAEMKVTAQQTDHASASIDGLGKRANETSSAIGHAAHKALAWSGAMVGLNEIRGVVDSVLETGAAFEKLELRLTGILGGAEKARVAMAMIRQLAKDTPYDVAGLTDAYARLSAFGLIPTQKQMLAIADASSLLGGGIETLNGVTLALGQAWTKNKLQGEEILQLAERGIPVWELLAKATGKTTRELMALSEAGQLGRDAITKLIEAMGSKAAGASADLMNSYAGAVDRSKDALQEFFNMIAQSGVLEYLTQQLQGLLIEFDHMKDSGQLQVYAKQISTAFIDISNTVQGLIGVMKAVAPAIEIVMKLFVVSRLAGIAAALAGVSTASAAVATSAVATAKATDLATAALARQGQVAAATAAQTRAASMINRAGILGVGMAALELGQRLLEMAKNYGAYRAELNKANAIQERVDQGQQKQAARLKEISAATGVTVTSMQELNTAQAAGLIVFDQATSKWLSAAQAQAQLAGALQKTKAELANVDASVIVAQFDAAVQTAGKAEAAIGSLAEALKFKDVQGAGSFVLALDQIQAKGTLTAEQVGKAWQEALAKISTGNLGALRANLEEAARAGVISAKQLAQANDQILTSSFERLGVNSAQALGKISHGAQEAINAVGLIADAAAAAGVKSTDSARAIEMAFAEAVPKADSLQAIDQLQRMLNGLGAAGKISAEGVQRSQEALAKQRATIEGQIPGIQSLGEALRTLGVKPQSELKAMAETAKQAFKVVSTSGTATKREVDEAWRVMAQSAIDANGGVADAALKAQAAQHNMAIEVDDSGKAMVKSLDGAKKSADDFGEASRHAGTQAADGATEAVDAIDEVKKAHEAVTAVIEYTWLSAAAQTSKYRDEAAKYADQIEGQWQSMSGQMILSWHQWNEAVNRHFAILTNLSDQYAKSLERIDERQQALEDRNSGTARGIDGLRMRLIELNGTEDEIAQARRQRDEDEVRRQIELQKLEIERATIRGDISAVNRYAAEIKLLEEQLKLIDQVFSAEKKKAQRDKQGGGTSGGTSGGGGSAGGGVTTERVINNSPVVNFYGVTDVDEFARKLRPVWKQMDTLAR